MEVILYSIEKVLKQWPCHRIPSRCFHMGTWQMPLCYRCTGIIFGFPFGLLIGFLNIFSSRWPSMILLIPILLDVGTQEAGHRESNNILRILTGFLAGLGVGIFLFVWIQNDIKNITFSTMIKESCLMRAISNQTQSTYWRMYKWD